MDENGDITSTIDQQTTSIGDNKALNSTLLYRKKFKKQGRTISVTFNQDYKENESQGFLYSKNEYFSNGGSTQEIVDQKKINDNITSLVNERYPIRNRLVKGPSWNSTTASATITGNHAERPSKRRIRTVPNTITW